MNLNELVKPQKCQSLRNSRLKVTNPSAVCCILHAKGINHGDFILFSNIKGSASDKLSQLQSIKERCLCEPRDSPHRMEDVCSQVPQSLAEMDLNAVGYHPGCYQAFTKNQDRLKHDVNLNEPSTSRSPRKPTLFSAMHLFPPECIFCERLEKKLGGKTERCTVYCLQGQEWSIEGAILEAN